MFYLIKESFKITNKYIAFLVTPLVLFSFLSSLYLIFSSTGKSISLLISIFLFVLMLTAFLAGWLNMVVNGIKNNESEDNHNILIEFVSGVGEFFVSTLGMLFNIFIISTITYFIAHIIGMHYIGDMGISAEALRNSQASVEAAKNFYNSLSPVQLNKLALWSLLSIIAAMFNSFIVMFYAPILFYKEKNPFKALYITIKELFSKRFFKNILLFVIIIASYFVLTILTGIMSLNIFTQFIMTLINFYYIVLIAILVFNYYYTNYIKVRLSV